MANTLLFLELPKGYILTKVDTLFNGKGEAGSEIIFKKKLYVQWNAAFSAFREGGFVEFAGVVLGKVLTEPGNGMLEITVKEGIDAARLEHLFSVE